ncbi:hypothetical protein HGA91_02745 [candidate division WWE3 bacterium]|nr:hypothetical protein [candidate division WWE3 bacterium]
MINKKESQNISFGFLLGGISIVAIFLLIANTFPIRNKELANFFSKSTSSAAVSSSILANYPFPRGSAPPYGWYGCQRPDPNTGWLNPITADNECIKDNYTLIQHYSFGLVTKTTSSSYNYSNSYGNYAFSRGMLTHIEALNRQKQYLLNMGCNHSDPGCYDRNLWFSAVKWLKDQGWTDQDLFAFYATDETWTRDHLLAIRDSVRQYFPQAIVVHSMNHRIPEWDNGYADKIDVVVIQSYPTNKGEKVAGTYLTMDRYIPRWREFGKKYPGPLGATRPQGVIAYHAVDTYQYCKTTDTTNVDINSDAKKYQRTVHQVILGILAGAQGAIPYYLGDSSGTNNAWGTPCEDGFYDFYPTYAALWPWIMQADRIQLNVDILSGLEKSKTNTTDFVIGLYDEIPQQQVEYPGVIAWGFKDANSRPMYIAASMYAPSDTTSGNTARVNGIANGTYQVYGENRTVTVNNGSIQDTFLPYGYHIYIPTNVAITSPAPLTATPTVVPTSTIIPTISPSLIPTPTTISSGNLLREEWYSLQTTVNANINDLIQDTRFPNNPDHSMSTSNIDSDKNISEYYGVRIRGILIPPSSGNYQFVIAGDDTAQIKLSKDNHVSLAQVIAYTDRWTSPYEWGKYASQTSKQIELHAGGHYYFEVLQAESIAEDHVSVGWIRPGQSSIEIIPPSVFGSLNDEEGDTDINSDGQVDVFDLGILAAHYGQSISISSDELTLRCDINLDDSINVFDLGVLIGHYIR